MQGKPSAVDVDSDELVTEAQVERAGDREAEARGAILVKGNLRGRRDWPDKFYFFPGARLLFVEYKRPGETPRKSQQTIHRRLRRRGYQVAVVDQIEEAKAVIRRFTRGEVVDPRAAAVDPA